MPITKKDGYGLTHKNSMGAEKTCFVLLKYSIYLISKKLK